MDVAVAEGRVAMFGDCAHTVGPETETIDAEGAYLVPGLIDTHLHVESVMVTVTRFAEAVLPRGTTTVVHRQPRDGERLRPRGDALDARGGARPAAEGVPGRAVLRARACRASRTPAPRSGPRRSARRSAGRASAGLGEMMNMPGVIDGDENMHAEIAATLERGMPVTGHWSLAGQRDHRLQAYIAAGVDSCHETTTREDALAKLRAGMWVQFREGSTFRDVAALAPVLTEDGVDPRHCLLVTDDVLPDTVVADGHMDRVVRRAIEEGIDPLVAIQMATVNGAEYFGMRHDLGSIAPGRLADILFVEDLRDFRPHRVLVDGQAPGELPALRVPARGLSSRSGSARPLDRGRPEDRGLRRVGFACVRSASPRERVTTEHVVVEVPVADGEVRASAELDLAKAASIERHGGPGTIGLGFVTGLGLQRGAVGSTVAHDNHNVLVAGMSDADMILAVERLAEVGGGMIAVADGEVLALVELPIAGLISDRPVAEVAEQTLAL